MGLWPFGRAKADVETASRVVVLRARDAVPMRAKITVKFAEPLTQVAADEMAEACSDLVRSLVREAPAAPAVLGCEVAIAAEVSARLPKDAAPLRSLEIAGLHIIGDPGHAQRSAAGETSQWLQASPSPSLPGAGEARPLERTADRLTPIYPLDRPTPVQPLDRPTPAQPLERPTPIHALPSARASAVKAPAARGSAPQAVALNPPRDPLASTATTPAAAARAATAPAAVRAAPAAPTPATPMRAISLSGADPFAATATSPSPLPPAEAREQEPAGAAPAGRVKADVPLTPPSPYAKATPSPNARPTPFPGTVMIPPSRPSSPYPGTAVPPSRPSSPYPGTAVPASRPSGPRSSSSSAQMPAILLPDEASASSRSYSNLSPPSSPAPASAPPSSLAAASRRASARPPPAAIAARRRMVAARFPLPAGAGPYEVARGLTPLFRDTAGRILVAFLRAYDLTVIRRVPFDAIESDILSSLTAPSDGAPGTYAASHAAEINRWRSAFGASTMDKLQREANIAAAAIGHEMLSAEGVAQRTVNAVVEGLSGSAFGDPEMLIELGRYLFPAHPTMSAETLASMIEIAGEDMPPGLETALDPLFVSLREEIAAAALIAKDVMTGAPPSLG